MAVAIALTWAVVVAVVVQLGGRTHPRRNPPSRTAVMLVERADENCIHKPMRTDSRSSGVRVCAWKLRSSHAFVRVANVRWGT